MAMTMGTRLAAPLCCALLALVGFGDRQTIAQEPPGSITVKLDTRSLPAPVYKEMPYTADRVAELVPLLIPGKPLGYDQESVLCFVTPQPQPIILAGVAQYSGEPPGIPARDIHIAVSGVLPNFAYQLAHELAHVKMGAYSDNYLVEFFALSVALEVLRQYPLPTYLDETVQHAVHDLPPNVQIALSRQDHDPLIRYWLGEAARQNNPYHYEWPYDLDIFGTLLSEPHGHCDWLTLLDIPDAHRECKLKAPLEALSMCQPDLAELVTMQPVLRFLGYEAGEQQKQSQEK